MAIWRAPAGPGRFLGLTVVVVVVVDLCVDNHASGVSHR